MHNKTRILIVPLVVLMVFGLIQLVSSASLPHELTLEQPSNFPYIEENLVSSSRYTRKEAIDPVKLNNYMDNFQLMLSHEEILERNYTQAAETSDLVLYYHSTSFSILIKNKSTNYVWSSRAEFVETGETTRIKLNEMESGIWVEYVLTNSVSRRISTSNVLAERAAISYRNLTTQNGFKALINFTSLGFKFEVEVYLENNQLVVHVDNSTIEETSARYSLIGIQVFPFLGSARQNQYPGYLFIPDGAGALVRFEDRTSTFYQAKYYGPDLAYGISTANRYKLSMPVFGIVHQVYQDGLFAIVEEGDLMANLSAYFWGYENSNYFRMSPRFLFREVFTNVIDKTGFGPDAIDSNINPNNITLRYYFLSGANADYVGMANTYKGYLESKNVLPKQSEAVQDIGIALDYLISDLEPSFLGSRSVSMTTPKDILDMYDYFKTMDIQNQKLNLLGWSTSGLSDTAPYATKLFGNRNDYREMMDQVEQDGNSVYFMVNYTTATADSSRIRYSRDVARMMSKLKMDIMVPSVFVDRSSLYYLYPETSYLLASRDYSTFQRLGIDKLSFQGMGNTLFGYYANNQRYPREESLGFYQQVLDLYGSTALYAPNAYMYEYTENYLNIPIYNSQHDYFTDLVPFLPIVLKGNIEYFAHYLNFNSMGIDQILSLIDFGVSPSYLLTADETYKMRYTKSSMYYTTYFGDFKEKIVQEYSMINQALRYVQGSSIVRRTILDSGIVAVEYSNGRIIYINYTSFNYLTDESITIPAKNYRVV